MPTQKTNGSKRPTIKGLQSQVDALKRNSALLDRANLAQRAGLQFGGDRDLYNVFGYKLKIDHTDFAAKYLRQDIAARIVEAPAFAVWGLPPKVFSPSNDTWAEEWEKLVAANAVWTFLQRTDILAGLGRFAVLLMGFNDTGNTSRPVNNADTLLYLQPYGERLVDIEKFIDDPLNPRFNLPEMYKIKRDEPSRKRLAGGVSTEVISELQVHWSRLLHVVEAPLEDTTFGTPRIARVYNLLDDLLKVIGGSAEAFWLTARGGLQVDIDKDMDLDVDDAAALSTAIDEYIHQMRRVLRTRGVDIKTIDTEVADPTGTFRAILALISGATGIPQRILLGSEAGQLASEQDRANWAERINDRRVNFAQPQVLEPFVKMLMASGVLDEADDLQYVWPEAFRLSPLERSETMAQVARAVVNLSRQAKDGFPLIDQEEGRLIIGLSGTKDLSDLIPDDESNDDEDAEDAADGAQDDPDSGEPANSPVDTGGGEAQQDQSNAGTR